MQIPESELFSIKEAANSIQASYALVRNAIYAGDLPAFKKGPKLIRIKKEDFQIWVNKKFGDTNLIPFSPCIKLKYKKRKKDDDTPVGNEWDNDPNVPDCYKTELGGF